MKKQGSQNAFFAPHFRKQGAILLIVFFVFMVAFLTFFIGTRTFSNTSIWDPKTFDILETPYAPAPPDWERAVTIPPPPANLSLETLQDVIALFTMRSLRTPERVEEISNQHGGDNLSISGHTFAEYMDHATFPATAAYLDEPYLSLFTPIVTFKQRFDRPRPTALVPFLGSTLKVPGHPSYPNGTGTEAYFIAYMLSAAIPERSEEYMNDAVRIAKNREIAGVHYPSDTEAGRQLAEQWSALWLPRVSQLIPEVREELLTN